MTYTPTLQLVQPTITISDARQAQLTAAMSESRLAMEATAQTVWTPYVETPAEQRANARAARIAWVIDSM